MMKKSLITLSAVACLSTASFANADLSAQIEAMKAQIAALEAKLDKTNEQVKKVDKLATTAKIAAAKDNLKFDVDFRTSIDQIEYKMADGTKQSNDGLLINRLWLNGAYAPSDNVSFRTTLSYMKAFGDSGNHAQANTVSGSTAYNYFDWVTNENANDNTLKVKEAYWLYQNDTFLGTDVHWTASVGRRPSTDGLGINLREGEPAKSPLSHTVNVEFDGASFKFDLDKVTPMTGSWLKLCMGRGLSNARPRFTVVDTNGQYVDYSVDPTKNPDVDMVGFIFVPYDDGQYSLHTNWARGLNMIGFDAGGSAFDDMGNLDLWTAMLKVDGIGDGISDFLDDTTLFVSYAHSKSDPSDGKYMLGSTESLSGHSEWIGLNMPAGGDARWGIEWNQGSEDWRSVTYAEDTLIGSKVAARGTAWEVYYNKPLVKGLTFNARYTEIDYDYSGSNGFFGVGSTSTAVTSGMANGGLYVDKATDLRMYIKYNF